MAPRVSGGHKPSSSLDALAEEVVHVNRRLASLGLVVGSSGNASGLDRESQLVAIKPSGLECSTLTLRDIVVVDLAGEIRKGHLRPSIDTPCHLEVYRRVPHIRGIVHTHSSYATAFAARAEPIRPYVTSIADMFGDEITCIEYVGAYGELGDKLANVASAHPACLVARHGIFAFGASPGEAFKVAVMVEAAAKAVHLALMLGPLAPLPQEEVSHWHIRYKTRYGQQNTEPFN